MEIYDLKKDPQELQNEYSNPEYEVIIAKMKTELAANRIELKEGDTNYQHIQEVIEKHWND